MSKDEKKIKLKKLFDIMGEDVANSHHLSISYLAMIEEIVWGEDDIK
jgi:hypothetical protein